MIKAFPKLQNVQKHQNNEIERQRKYGKLEHIKYGDGTGNGDRNQWDQENDPKKRIARRDNEKSTNGNGG